MVDLEAAPTPVDTTAMDGSTGLCRLCLRHHKPIMNIFEEELVTSTGQLVESNTAGKKVPLVKRLFDVLRIKFERSTLLPSCICSHCLAMVDAFTDFRENVQRCETELQRWLERNSKNAANSEDQRPGLNGNPGNFEPEPDCIITNVDPEQDYESSEDDFSMESDSEVDERPASSPQTSHNGINDVIKLSSPTIEKDGNVSAATLPRITTELSTADLPHILPDVAIFASMPASTVGDTFAAGDLVAKNTYLCQYCDMAFTTQPDCIEHESRHDTAAPYVCSFCSQRTSSRQNLIYHIKELHDPERPYVCALCNKGFCRRSDLKKHTIVHTGVRPFTCPVCAKSFSRNTNLTKHMRIHNSVKPHVCQRCPRSFSTAAELIRHTRSHTELKAFQCSRCSASFTRKDKLHLHEQAHYRRDSEFLMNQAKGVAGSGDSINGITNREETRGVGQMENIVVALNPYGEQEAPNTHINVPSSQEQYRHHSILAAQLQQRPLMAKPPPPKPHPRMFTCTICQKTFTRERDLQRHQALHLDTLFTCKQCGTGFNRREKLARHELEFHAPQHPCDICRIQFSKRDEYEMHMKMHELQQNAAMATQAAISAASGIAGSPIGAVMGMTGNSNNTSASLATNMPGVAAPSPNASLSKDASCSQHRPSAADMSFYSQLVPTMNLGFYSETRPENDV